MVMDVHGRNLRYFVALAEELHCTRGRAVVRFTARPEQVRILERQLGAPLFERSRHDVSLTPAGAALLPHARRVLAEWDRAWQAAEQAKSIQRATLVVGMSTSPGRGGLLSAIRSRFTASHPEATVELRQVSWEDLTAGLADGMADVAFVFLPLPDPGRFRWAVVAKEPCLVAMQQPSAGQPRGHRFRRTAGRAVPRPAPERRPAGVRMCTVRRSTPSTTAGAGVNRRAVAGERWVISASSGLLLWLGAESGAGTACRPGPAAPPAPGRRPGIRGRTCIRWLDMQPTLRSAWSHHQGQLRPHFMSPECWQYFWTAR